MKKQKENSHEGITWSEMGKQNVQAEKVYLLPAEAPTHATVSNEQIILPWPVKESPRLTKTPQCIPRSEEGRENENILFTLPKGGFSAPTAWNQGRNEVYFSVTDPIF